MRAVYVTIKAMLEIITSNTVNSAARAVIDRLGEYDCEDVRHVVIVPDRFTMSVETEIFRRLGLSGAFNIEVVSFTRFAVKELKTKSRKALTKEGAVILLGEVAKDLADELEYFHEPDKKRGLMRDLYAVIASIRTSGIGADELFGAFKEGNDRISRKYRDVARLYRLYEERVKARYSDTVTRLQLFLNELPQMPEISGTRVYVLGFTEFTAVELSVMTALERSAKSLTVGLFVGFKGATHGLNPTRTLAKVRNVSPKAAITHVEKPLDGAVSAIVGNVYGYRAVTADGGGRVVPFFENTPYDEVNTAAKEILTLIAGGKRYKDIAVVLCAEDYKSIIKDVFGRFGIPVFIDEKYPLKNTVAARLLLAGIRVAATGTEREAFLAFAKNPMIGIPYCEIEELENFILKNNINYSRLNEPFDGRYRDFTDGVETVRKTVVKKLPAIKKNDTAKGYAAALSDFISEFEGAEPSELFGENSACRDSVLEALNEQSIKRILEQTDELATIIGDRVMDCKELLNVVSSAIDSVDISLIPDSIDSVFVGAGEDSPFFDKKVMFVLGAAAGHFPKESGWQAVLTERDAAAVFAKGFELYPTPVDKLKSDKAAVLDLLTKADERIYISCPSYSVDGTKQTASEALRQIARTVGAEAARLSDKFSLKRGEAAAVSGLGNLKNAAYELRKAEAAGISAENAPFYAALRRWLTERGELSDRDATEEKEERISLFEESENGRTFTSVSRVETFMCCPYKYFLRYGLSAAPREEGEIRIPDLGSIIHRVLELLFRKLKGHFRVATDEEIAEETQKAVEEAFSDTSLVPPGAVEKNAVVFGNVRREAEKTASRLVSYVRQSKFEPTYFEVRFGDGARTVSVATDAGEVFLTGKIDRVDRFGDKFTVMDYKTGKTAGIADVRNLYYGKHIQLYVYPVPFENEGMQIAGAYYVPISGDYKSEGSAASKRFEGKTSSLWSDVQALDKTLDPYGKTSSEFLPVDLTVKDGEIGYKKPADTFSPADFAFAEEYALETVANAINAMHDGFIKRIPLKDECKYCEFATVCGDVPERKMKSVKLTDGNFYVSEGLELGDD